jgi:hypothetical protein
MELYRIKVIHHGGGVRHITYFTDKSIAEKCVTIMQNYYNRFLNYRPYVFLTNTLWMEHDKKGYSNTGENVENLNELYKHALMCDQFVSANADEYIITHMFGEKLELGSVLKRIFASNTTFYNTGYTFKDGNSFSLFKTKKFEPI